MNWIKAMRSGLALGKPRLLASGVYYAEALLLSFLALAPLGAGLHAVLDRSPEARALATGAGIDLLGELGVNQPGFWAAGFGAAPWVLILHAALAIALAAGATALAVRKVTAGSWKAYWKGAGELSLPFAGLLALNALLWGIAGAVPILSLVGIGKALEGNTNPGVFWTMLGAWAVVLFVLLSLFKAGVGFSRARRALVGPGEGLGKTFLFGIRFSLRKVPGVLGMTAGFLVLRAFSMWILYLGTAPGYATAGAAFLSALMLQVAFAAQACLRVAEIGAQVAYLEGFGEGAPAKLLQQVVADSQGEIEGEPQPGPAAERSPTIL